MGVGPSWTSVASGAILTTVVAIALERGKIGIVK